MNGWKVEVEFTGAKSSAAQSNSPAQKVACDFRDNEKDSTESRNFFCPSRTAANVIRVIGNSPPVQLAEIVIAGKAWDKYPCDKGYYNAVTGTHKTTGQDCQICKDGERNHERGKKQCTPCENAARNIYYTKDFAHKTEEKCQVCIDYQVANAAKDGCLVCKAGEEFKEDCTDFAATDKVKLEACTGIKCKSCTAGNFRSGTAAKSDQCLKCPVNEYSGAKASECIVCEKHKHSVLGSPACTDCKGKTYQDVIKNDISLGDTSEQFYKCLRDTGEACVASTAIESVYGSYEPKYLKLGDKKTIDCYYDCTNKAGSCELQAVFSCEKAANGKVEFKAVYHCVRTKATEEFETLNKQDKSNIDKSEDFKKLSEENDKKNNGLGDLDQAAKMMEDMVNRKEDKVNTKVVSNMFEGVSNIIDGDLKTNYSEKSNILNRVVESLSKITQSTDESNNLVTSSHIAAIKVTGKSHTETKFGLPVNDSSLKSLQVNEVKSEDVVLMVTAKDEGKAKDLAIVLFQNSKLFPDSETTTPDPTQMKKDLTEGDVKGSAKPPVVNSLVVEVSAVEDKDKPYALGLYMRPLANLGSRNESIKTFPDGTKKQLQNRCHSLNTATNKWQPDCETVYNENDPDSRVLCLCKHNTSFAVLMSPYEIPPGLIESQTLMSTIILSLAMVCLMLTIALLLPAAPLRKQRSTKINICFSVSLLLASFLFLLQNALVKSDDSGPIKLGSAGCVAYAAIQHYIWLVVFLWMVVEGILMYLSLVQVFGSHISKYMLKFNLLCWGVPIVFPIIGYFAFTKTVTVGDYSVVKSDYLADNMCFLKPGELPFYIFFFLPLVLALLVNVVFFLLVLRVIKDTKSVQASERELILRQIKAAVGVMVLLGTGWLIGIFMAIPEPKTQIALQYIFILLNSSQGIGVFIFYVVLNDQVTNHWLTTLGLKTKVASSSNSSAAKPTSTTNNTLAKSKTENVYENAAAVGGSKDNDHTYDTAFPAKSDGHGNI